MDPWLTFMKRHLVDEVMPDNASVETYILHAHTGNMQAITRVLLLLKSKQHLKLPSEQQGAFYCVKGDYHLGKRQYGAASQYYHRADRCGHLCGSHKLGLLHHYGYLSKVPNLSVALQCYDSVLESCPDMVEPLFFKALLSITCSPTRDNSLQGMKMLMTLATDHKHVGSIAMICAYLKYNKREEVKRVRLRLLRIGAYAKMPTCMYELGQYYQEQGDMHRAFAWISAADSNGSLFNIPATIWMSIYHRRTQPGHTTAVSVFRGLYQGMALGYAAAYEELRQLDWYTLGEIYSEEDDLAELLFVKAVKFEVDHQYGLAFALYRTLALRYQHEMAELAVARLEMTQHRSLSRADLTRMLDRANNSPFLVACYVRAQLALKLENWTRATKELRLLCNMEYLPAFVALANVFLTPNNGCGTPVEASYYLMYAAEQGCSMAQLNLGSLFYQGYGVRRDLQEARRLFCMAMQGPQPQPLAHLLLLGAYLELHKQPLSAQHPLVQEFVQIGAKDNLLDWLSQPDTSVCVLPPNA